MSTAIITVIEQEVIEQLNAAHAVARHHESEWGQAAWHAGKILVDVKEQLSHGEFGPWLEKYFDGSRSSAEQYMRLARRYANPQLVTEMGGQKKALEAVATPRPKPESAPEPEPYEPLAQVHSIEDIRGERSPALEQRLAETRAAKLEQEPLWSSMNERKFARTQEDLDRLLTDYAMIPCLADLGPRGVARKLRAVELGLREAATAISNLAFEFEK